VCQDSEETFADPAQVMSLTPARITEVVGWAGGSSHLQPALELFLFSPLNLTRPTIASVHFLDC
jgi:hypothetical protein